MQAASDEENVQVNVAYGKVHVKESIESDIVMGRERSSEHSRKKTFYVLQLSKGIVISF